MPEPRRTFELAGSERSAALAAVGWQGRLEGSRTVADVLSVVRDYLALWSPQEVSQLPPECRPGKIVDPDDVAELAVQLARATLDSAPEAQAPLRKMCDFVTRASLRLSRLVAQDQQPA
ncbi:MAG TPA: hypothetical protein VLC53_14615 [Myxococcota bacterium]|nr:hypothetical protein [Myxococcota bacterium]